MTPVQSLLLVLLTLSTMQQLRGAFDIRRQLATKTRYAFRLPIPSAPSIYTTPDPPGYEPVHMWLLSRHGTRWPTADRAKQIASLRKLFRDARNTDDYPWVSKWVSPVANASHTSGELHPIGEGELWGLARRLRARFPSLAAAPYLPKRYPVISTAVPRASASASAFASGYFPAHAANATEDEETAGLARVLEELSASAPDDSPSNSMLRDLLTPLSNNFSSRNGDGPGTVLPGSGSRPQAIALTMAPKSADPLLRFFDL
eukprot:CAMPEP_0202877880 /NCGR_PEP_ID=MMETSP1391-20130828/31289_1 /ASSEMBLY_ACC=CAM_ASM_000867 /TAXON_ID=1034604 /ORGANISM="Chlamydomonas leiostraca, Strain SAG 11-49" /LENGTH=259 /DNA_ID=CAMNT_0049559983 /DNA_START=49 /DNA_END=824 /DNA_ORIENTATION=-